MRVSAAIQPKLQTLTSAAKASMGVTVSRLGFGDGREGSAPRVEPDDGHSSTVALKGFGSLATQAGFATTAMRSAAGVVVSVLTAAYDP
jgi:hypothetical protein